jgi:hypothetical protein
MLCYGPSRIFAAIYTHITCSFTLSYQELMCCCFATSGSLVEQVLFVYIWLQIRSLAVVIIVNEIVRPLLASGSRTGTGDAVCGDVDTLWAIQGKASGTIDLTCSKGNFKINGPSHILQSWWKHESIELSLSLSSSTRVTGVMRKVCRKSSSTQPHVANTECASCKFSPSRPWYCRPVARCVSTGHNAVET